MGLRVMPDQIIRLGGGGLRSYGPSLVYLLRDIFSTDVASPQAASRSAEPGPGRMVKSADTAGNVSLANGALKLTGTGTTVYIDPAYSWDGGSAGFDRVAGRTVFFRVVPKDLFTLIHYSVAASVAAAKFMGVSHNTGAWNLRGSGANTAVNGAYTIATTYLIALTLRADGLYLFAIGGAMTAWTLLAVYHNWTETPIVPTFGTIGAQTAQIAEVAVRDIGSDFAADTLPLWSVSNPATGATATVGAAAWFTVRAGALPYPGSGYQELRYRRQDANNYCLIRLYRSVTDGQWRLVTGHVIAGVETLQGSPTGNVFGSGVQGAFAVRVNGDNHEFFTSSSTTVGTAWTKQYATIVDANFNTATGAEIVWTTAAAPVQVVGVPLTDARFAALGAYTTQEFMTLGDSKTANYFWQRDLCVIRSHTAQSKLLYEAGRLATGGHTISSRRATIDADLAAATNTPEVVLWNFGANDVAAWNQTTFETDYAYCLAACHAKWPNAKHYLTKVWRTGYTTELTQLAASIDTLVAARAGWCFVGDDERTYLTTLTSDGVHPTAAGEIAMAQAKSVLW